MFVAISLLALLPLQPQAQAPAGGGPPQDAPQGKTPPGQVRKPVGPNQNAAAEKPEPTVDSLEEVLVDHDDFVLDHSAHVRFPAEPILDANGDGVLVVRGEDLFVDLSGSTLRGAAPGVTPDAYAGTGIRVEGARVTLRGARVSGFHVGIDARGVDGLVIEDTDVSDGYRQHLGSTPMAEDSADWLFPHDNDGGEWLDHYGAGIHVQGAKNVTVRRCRARDIQNGLILDRVTDSGIYDNDFSFLSGWGIAMWRSSKNTVTRNLLDFCVRGYSDGVYNRGQDSAGLLLFEQCCDNVIAENSITHGGDGVFGFAGKEALGDNPPPEGFDYSRKGCNRNLFVHDDLAYCAAHGLELTFSFSNTIFDCRFVSNAICGIWGGYSHDSVISRNIFRGNGEMAYGQERGGVNIEHGAGNLIQYNRFIDDACGVAVWWDADPHLKDKPWVKANGFDCGKTAIYDNGFVREKVGIEVRDCPDVRRQGNHFQDCGDDIVCTHGMAPKVDPVIVKPPPRPKYDVLGKQRAVGARRDLEGRDHIVMTEWGPYAWDAPLLWRGPDRDGAQVWHVLGVQGAVTDVKADGDVAVEQADGSLGPEILARPKGSGWVRYGLTVTAGDTKLHGEAQGLLARWDAHAFAWKTDPREDEAGWRAEAASGVPLTLTSLDLNLGGKGLADLPALSKVPGLADLPADDIGLIATTTLDLPAGDWVLHTRSDDGIRVTVDGKAVVEDWTHHAGTDHDATLSFDKPGKHAVEVEWFELDGGAELAVDLRRVGG